jgi:hypothetical protein
MSVFNLAVCSSLGSQVLENPLLPAMNAGEVPGDQLMERTEKAEVSSNRFKYMR